MSGIHALVLAAGAGVRFGGRKLTAPWRGGVLLDGALDAALAAPVDGVVVVTGADPGVTAVVAAHNNPRLRCVHAPDHALGLSASLKAGLAALPADARGALIFLGDMPALPSSVFRPLVDALAAGASAAAPIYDGVRGHPVALSRALFGEIMALTGDRGAGGLLDSLGEAVAMIATDERGVLMDVDHSADLGTV